ncbi:MAG: M48 family metalloprotease [Armatimonadetes bacterium]|nr:M48 family metalloprotease [Armatimonadota bacterium]
MNLVAGACLAAPGVALLLGGVSLGTRVLVAGAVFGLSVLPSQAALSAAAYPHFRLVRGADWLRSAFTFRLLVAGWALGLPVAVTAMLFGAVQNLLFIRLQPADHALTLAVTVLLCLLWVVQWPVLRALSLPGTAAEFPRAEWKSAAVSLGKRMDVPLNDLLLIHTHRAPTAGAFALGRGRVAITDFLLSAIDEDEFLAVVAHELHHFRQRSRTVALILALMAGAALLAVIAALFVARGVLPAWAAVVLSFALAASAVAPLVRRRQRYEDEADDAAALHVGSWPLMTAIAKVHALNGRAGDAAGSTIHRSLRDRLRRLASCGGLDGDAVQRAISLAKETVAEPPQVCLTRPLVRAQGDGQKPRP